MKTSRTTLSLLMIAGLLLANFSTVLAGGPPGLPSSFYGTVMVDGSSVPAGVSISAWINGVSYASSTTKLNGSQIMYSINIPADDVGTSEIEGGKTGDTVVFHVGDLTAVETGTWNVANVQLNLTTWNEYTLTVTSAYGTVIRNPNKATYHLNDSVSLLADPVDGWSFTSWIGAASGSANPAAVVIAGNTSVTANYSTSAITCHLLSLGHSGNGSTPTAAPANSTGCPAGYYVTGAAISLSGALSDNGWYIGGWTGTGNDASTADSNAVTMPAAAHNVSVIYEKGIDTSQPTVTIEKGAAQAIPASTVPVVFDVVFSEDVTGFEGADVAITGTAKGTKVVTVSGSGAAYTVEVKGITSSGTLIANIAAGAAQDGAGNLSQASTSLDNQVAFIMPAKPGTPKLLLPASAVIIDNHKPAFDWSDSVPAVVNYQIQVGTSSRFTAGTLVIDQNNIVESNYTAGADLLPGMRYYWRVRGFNAAEIAGAWSSARSLRTPLDEVNLISIGDGEGKVYTDQPGFNWDDVAGATKYRIQISKTNTFKSLVLNKTSASSELTPTGDLPVNSLLYWRVRAESAYVTGPWLEVEDFITGNPPTVPTLVSPKNKALTTDYTPKLDWKNSSVPKGTVFDHYQVQVSATADFAAPLVDEETEVGVLNSEYTLEDELAANTTYYWRVRAYNETAEYSGWSAVWALRTAIVPPELNAPESGKDLLTDRPEFDWNEPAGATSYVIQVSKVNTFKSLVLNKTATISSYVPTSDLPADTLLYWRVQAKGPNGPSLWSAVWRFTTGNPPGVPTLSSPANKALTTNYTPKFDWSNSSIPKGTTFDHYQIQVASSDSFAAIVIEQSNLAFSDYVPDADLTANTTFYWRVRAYNTDGEVSGWSAVRTLRTAIAPPALTSPVGGAAVGSLKPAFDWEDRAGATGYTIQVSKVNTFKSLVLNKKTTTSAYVPTSNLPAGQTLYWRVQASGVNGPSDWSEVESFTTGNPPGVPTLRSLANKTLTTDYSPRFDWSDSSVPAGTTLDHYQIQVATEAAFGATVIDTSDALTAPTVSEFTPTIDLIPNTTFYWRVRAINTDGEVSGWSAVWTLRTAIAPPVMTYPKNGEAVESLKPTFDWLPAAGATSYAIQVSKVDTFKSLVLSKTASGSAYTPTSNLPAGQTLYWRVQAKGANGPSAWSAVESFVTP